MSQAMEHHPVYDDILNELAGELKDLEHQVFTALQTFPDGLTRAELIGEIYGWSARYNAEARGLATNAHDRKIRKAIESMRNRMIPIVSTSSKAGYRLDTSAEAVTKMLNEIQARIDKLTDQKKLVKSFYHIPEEVPTAPATANQPALTGWSL